MTRALRLMMETFPWFPRGAVSVVCAYPSHITRCDMSPWCCAEYRTGIYPPCPVAPYQMRSDHLVTNHIRPLPLTPNLPVIVGISGRGGELRKRESEKRKVKIKLTDMVLVCAQVRVLVGRSRSRTLYGRHLIRPSHFSGAAGIFLLPYLDEFTSFPAKCLLANQLAVPSSCRAAAKNCTVLVLHP
ncbi:hypothetical protein B9Z19DRAFT_371999 [Tuber borchii]|uniref:Uncharacterized protein n=1 Tax=Tuber borchii TaxID=42251 RepID=A0A2T6ZHX5_TUBBO|nr:hypothetical protein B9Z19DRAFT_371999 [Tuber borchii]